MESQQQFHVRAVAIEEALPPGNAFHVTSMNSHAYGTTAGRVSIVNRQLAAKCIAQETHTLSTPVEIAQWVEDNRARREAILIAEQDRNPKTFMDPSVMAAMSAVATQAVISAQQQQQHQAKSKEKT